MTEKQIADLFLFHPAVQMLRLRNTPWILPFLYRVFKQENRFIIPEEQLAQFLMETLAQHEDGLEDTEEAQIAFGDDEQTRSRKYLLNWVQKRILQDFQDTGGAVHYQLSAHTEKVFQWMLTLQVRNHVGTESRFKLLLNSLRDVVEHTEDDRAKRLELLKNRRAEIDKEIKALELGKTLENYTNAQVQERIELFTRLCYELVSDFREVEDNFKQIHRSIVEQHTKAEQHKGVIVGYAFEAYDALRTSNQGKSFYAFWDFLISRAGQQDWKELIEQFLVLINDRGIEADTQFLQNVKSLLLEQGKSVYSANDRMADKLSRIITEKEIARHKRLRRQLASIKEMIFSLMDDENVPCGMHLDEEPDIKMVMERKLVFTEKKALAQVKQPRPATESITDPQRFARLLKPSFVDKKILWQKVESVLKQKQTATLKEIIEKEKLEHGLAEVITYYGFLKDKSRQVQILEEITELIPLDKEETKFVEVPYLLFSK